MSAFISTAKDIRREGKVPTGLITTGLSASRSFFERVVSRSLNGGRNVCVSLTPGDAPNLKTLVKTLISRITQDGADDSDDDGDRPAARSKGPQLLKYDLQILQEWLALRDSEHVVIALSDSEAFDVNVLTDFVLLLK